MGASTDDVSHEAVLAAVRAILYTDVPAGERIQRLQRLLRPIRVRDGSAGVERVGIARTAVRRLLGRE